MLRDVDSPTSMGSSSSISSMPRSRGTIRNDYSIGHSGATSNSTARACTAFRGTLLAGWKRYKDHPDARVRTRFEREMRKLSGVYSSALWAMERQFRKVDREVSEQIRALRQEFKQESGIVSRMLPALLGPVLLWTTRREEKRLAHGKTYEPPTILERSNWVEA